MIKAKHFGLLITLFLYVGLTLAYEDNELFYEYDCSDCHIDKPKKIKGTPSKGHLTYLNNRCNNCHGDDGISDTPAAAPNLAGQKQTYLISALTAYKNCQMAGLNCRPSDSVKQRSSVAMEYYASNLNLQNMADIAAFLESKGFDAYCNKKQKKPATIDKTKQALYQDNCGLCHGSKGISELPNIPNIAFQDKQYLQKSITDYQTDAKYPNRNSYHMGEIYESTSDEDIRGALDYINSTTLACQ